MPNEKITAGRVVITSFTVDLLDILLNLGVAILTGSMVVLTQTLQGMADLTASVLLLVGVKASQREADETHQFGYGREVYFWTLMSAFVSLVVTSGLSIYLGWQRFIAPEKISNLPLAIAVLIIGIITNSYGASLSARRILKGESVFKFIRAFLDSPLVETKSTFFLDIMGSLSGVLGFTALVIFGVSGDFRFDGLGAMVIGFVMAAMIFVLISALRVHIIGKAAHHGLSRSIKEIVLTFPKVEKVTELKTLHLSSEKLLVNIDIRVPGELSAEELEDLTTAIKTKISSKIPEAAEIQIEHSTG